MSGADDLVKSLERLGSDAEEAMIDVITDLVTDTQQYSVDGINTGPATGAVYTRGGITHQASAPGEYPMSDTGRLASNIITLLPSGSSIEGQVGTNIEYGTFLEFGTSRMAARPWLMPSFEKAKVDVAKEVKQRFEGKL
jgi:HK97 gp10 family phage protein